MSYESQKKYFKSQKGKEALKRARQKYEASEKGKQAKKRQRIKRKIRNQELEAKKLEEKKQKYLDSLEKEKQENNNLIQNMSYEEILKKIEDYLPIKKIEKDKHGEVFTPPKLINEMFDNLPKSVWSNPYYKWLDPANGIGNFPMIAYSRLMNGLKDYNKNGLNLSKEQERSKYIITKMLYMVELNPKNVAVSRKIFGKDANIFCGSFLTEDLKDKKTVTIINPDIQKKFAIEKYDVIMGNPPFQKYQDEKRKGSYGGRTLWDKFVIESLKILKENGFLTFIHPNGWRGLGELHNLWDLLTKKQILYLSIFGEKEPERIAFSNVNQRVDLYVLQNKHNTQPTKVIDVMGKEHSLELNKMSFLPNYAYKDINKILTTDDKGIDVIYSRSLYGTDKANMKNNKNSEFKYPVIHSIPKDKITIEWYSNDNTKGHFGVSKVILNFNRYQYSHPEQNDYEGKYGMSQISFGIPIKSKKEGEQILKAIETPMFKKIIAATKWGAFQTDYRMFKYFKPDFYKIILEEDEKKTSKSKNKNI